MSLEKDKALVKTAYLLQLRHGPFTLAEVERAGFASQLQDALNLQYLAQQQEGQQRRYSLSERGRAQIRVVLAGGVYDVLHLGHLAALTEARSFGDVLVAVVATDVTVEMLKGRKPVFPQEDRQALVEGLKPVDRAILGYEDVGFGFEQVLVEVMPDVVAFGYDQESLERSVTEIITRRKLRIRTVKLTRYERERFLNSTSVRQKMSEQLR